MNLYNPLPYIGVPFVYLWNIIKDSDSTKGRIIQSVFGILLLYGGIWLLMKWHEVPTYYHVVKIARVYSKDTLARDYISAGYIMNLSSGGNIKPNDSILESEEYHFNMYPYPFLGKKGTPRITYAEKNAPFFREAPDLSQFIGEEMNKNLLEECDKHHVSLSDFEHGFYVLHLFQSDYSRLKNDKKFIFDSKSGEKIKSLTMGVYNDTVLENTPYAQRLPYRIQEKDPKFNHSYASLLMTYSEDSTTGMISDHLIQGGLDIWRKVLSMARLRDMTKANYVFSFETSAIDSITYYIHFSEPVSFSEMNVEPIKKDMNSVVFKASDPYERFALSEGVRFFVEFNESSNSQTIRVILLTALLALPLSLVIKNVWSLMVNATPPKRNKKVSNTQ